MIILILEDTPSAMNVINHSINLARELKPFETISVIKCSSIYQANRILSEETSIDLIITDLNMSKRGLSKEHYNKTHDGFLTGWIWYMDKISENENYEKTNVIVFSEYIEMLKRFYGNEETLNRKHGKKTKHIALMSKLGYNKESVIKTLGYKIASFIER